MSHNENRSHWFKEGAIGFGTGVLYGLTNVSVGHVSILNQLQALRSLSYIFY